jgi:TMEM175 potassium channel family protein
MSEPDPDHFEMRRLESLSNTIFGVAMTLLAYDLPKSGQFENLPGWADLYRLYSGRLTGFVLSFVIAGIFWFSHQRRLARQPYAGRNVVFLNLLFLLSIILLPVTNGLDGSYGQSHAVAVLFGLNLTAIAGLNSTLWLLIHRENDHRPELIASFFPLLVFIPGTVVALFSPQLAKYIWLLGFGGLFVRRFHGLSPNRPP